MIDLEELVVGAILGAILEIMFERILRRYETTILGYLSREVMRLGRFGPQLSRFIQAFRSFVVNMTPYRRIPFVAPFFGIGILIWNLMNFSLPIPVFILWIVIFLFILNLLIVEFSFGIIAKKPFSALEVFIPWVRLLLYCFLFLFLESPTRLVALLPLIYLVNGFNWQARTHDQEDLEGMFVAKFLIFLDFTLAFALGIISSLILGLEIIFNIVLEPQFAYYFTFGVVGLMFFSEIFRRTFATYISYLVSNRKR